MTLRQLRDGVQQRSNIEVNATRGDLPFRGIVFINPTAWEFYSSTGRHMALEWTRVLGFKTEFNGDHAGPAYHLLHEVTVSGEGRDEWPHELVADGFLSLHERARNLKRNIVRVVGH